MKILAVCQYYYPEQFRINDICESLVQHGHSVTVLTGLPNYPSGRIPNQYRFFKKRKERIRGVDILRCFEVGRRRGRLGLALNYLSYMVSGSVRALSLPTNYDAIFVYQLSPVTMALPGVVLKARSGAPLLLYCCDIWPESLKNMVSDEASQIYRLVTSFSTFLYSKCDAIAVTSRPFIEYLSRVHSLSTEVFTYIPQHAEDVPPAALNSSSNDFTDFVFMGNIGIAQDIGCILDAAERMRNVPRFRIHIVGDGSCLAASRRAAHEKQLDTIVVFHGRHSIDRMPEFYALADACILTLRADSMIGITMPSKLQGYMAAGKPVIAAIAGAAREAIAESECGVCVDPGDSQSLAAVMTDFIENRDAYADCGKNGRAYYETHFTKEVFMRDLEDALDSLVRCQRAADDTAVPVDLR